MPDPAHALPPEADRARRPGTGPGPALLPSLTRAFVAVGAAGTAAAALIMGLAARTQPALAGAASAYGVLALVMAGCWWLPRATMRRAVLAWLLALVGVIFAQAAGMGWGLHAPGLPVLGLIVCASCALAGRRAGSVMAAASVLALLTLAAYAPAPAPEPPGLPPLALLGIHLVVLAAGYACGLLLWRVVQRYVQIGAERERRFRRLLALATDGYWEIDAGYRLVSASAREPDERRLRPATGLGRRPWELTRFGCAPEVLDELIADLDRRQPFRERLVSWSGRGSRGGQPRHYLVSGEPRFDGDGLFVGYWGVARDVTAVRSTQAALQATETRYQELFTRIPTPLVVHQRQRIIDANPAALRLLGHASLATLVGTDLHTYFQSGDSRERARRRGEELAAAPIGSALPVTDFRLQLPDRMLAVRATGVRIDAPQGPAALAIFVDDTDRLAAEEAVRRSEALLSHLVATSPDLITLTDRESGRFVMVNPAFERLTGWPTDEAIGRTSLELGVWRDAAARQRLVDLLAERGSVADLAVEFARRDGTPLPMQVSAARFAMDRRDYLVLSGRDVSERERARLEREAILNNVSIGIAVTRERRFVLCNPHFERMFGWPAGALHGRPTSAVWADLPEYERLVAQLLPLIERGESVEFEARGLRRDGTHFPALVRAHVIDKARPGAGVVYIVDDVTERRAFEHTLARARDDAEAASRAKSAFLANTSHELRTPLNGLIGLARLAREPDLDDGVRAQYLNQIAEIAQALAGVISDILDVSKIEAGKLQLDSTVFDLGELLGALQITYGLLARSHPIALRFDVAPEARGPVRGDPVRVRQIVGNFLSNALKFTAAGEVVVAATRHGDDVRIEVRDTGAGIDEAVQRRLFEPFTQADQSTTRRFGGTGLGLSITRDLAQLMGGRVGLASVPGQGSTFWAQLPLPVAPAPLPVVTAATTGPGGAAAATLQGMRVLMVEDNAVNMMIAVAMLQRWGAQVEQATDGRQAVQAVRAAHAAGRPFDAVLMDVQMPVMSGHEATRELRAGPGGAALPVIALTAAALVTEREEALRSGMDDFLTKPIDAERLHAALLRWCSRGRRAGDAAAGTAGLPARAGDGAGDAAAVEPSETAPPPQASRPAGQTPPPSATPPG